MKNLLSEYYEEFHRERGKSGTVLLPERITFIIERVGKGKKVLDVGCRYGNLTKYYSNGNDVIGVDIDYNAMKICKQKVPLKPLVMDLNSYFSFKDQSFDVVVISEVLEHLPYLEITLSEISRVLKNDGILIGSVPNGTKLKNRIRFLFKGIIEYDRTHLRYFSASSIKSLIGKYLKYVQIILVSGKYAKINGSLFANYILFCAKK